MNYLDLAIDLKLANFNLNLTVKLSLSGITAIYGHSGCGKTSLLRCIAGLEDKFNGHVQFNSKMWQVGKTKLATHKRNIGYVFQEPSLFPHLTVKQNLFYGLNRKQTVNVSELEVQSILSTFDIADLLASYPSQLSGGQAQRVAIVRALLTKPNILLMDEPLAALDKARKNEILPYLVKLKTETKIPILYVSHSLDEISQIADDILLIDKGKLVDYGQLECVLANAEHQAVFADEVGCILTSEIVGYDEEYQILETSIAQSDFKLWLSTGSNAKQKQEQIKVRVKAKDVSISLNQPSDTSILNVLPARIVQLERQLQQSNCLIKLEIAGQFLFAQLTLKSVERLELKPEMKVWAQIKSTAILI
ncbi:molybdenum ABC transporter ATP-binding protein [Catenovulum maritimum]|uniref:Molybdenum import ATP-binding protein ModC n=1 Tax=Catenovulum maritimum TaxID=1513271 RepID=A0A0J8GN10_9ALTE|nr:molybdenum ABC transporter ATP-binding protein [Catenovulum maritimum]KMT64212.1 hypothetical protein XM47_15710 [Catenovulum maritimum]